MKYTDTIAMRDVSASSLYMNKEWISFNDEGLNLKFFLSVSVFAWLHFRSDSLPASPNDGRFVCSAKHKAKKVKAWLCSALRIKTTQGNFIITASSVYMIKIKAELMLFQPLLFVCQSKILNVSKQQEVNSKNIYSYRLTSDDFPSVGEHISAFTCLRR